MSQLRQFQDRTTGETLICDNPRIVRRFNGVEWLSVRRPTETQRWLKRRDELEEITPQ